MTGSELKQIRLLTHLRQQAFAARIKAHRWNVSDWERELLKGNGIPPWAEENIRREFPLEYTQVCGEKPLAEEEITRYKYAAIIRDKLTPIFSLWHYNGMVKDWMAINYKVGFMMIDELKGFAFDDHMIYLTPPEERATTWFIEGEKRRA